MLHRAFEIAPPRVEEAQEMIRLRARLFTEELVLSGVSEAAAMQHTAEWVSPAGIDRSRSRVAEWLGDRRMFVRNVYTGAEGTNDRRIVGLFVAHIKRRRLYYVRSIQLDSPSRGQGVGCQLFDELAAAGDGRATELHVFENNHPARSFYDKLGFFRIGRRRGMLIGGGHGVQGEKLFTLHLRKPGQS